MSEVTLYRNAHGVHRRRALCVRNPGRMPGACVCCMLMFLCFFDINPTHKGGHVTKHRSFPQHWSSPPSHLPIPWTLCTQPRSALRCTADARPRKVDIRLPGKGDSNSHGARPAHQKHRWTRTSRLSIKNSLSLPGLLVHAVQSAQQPTRRSTTL